MLSRSSKKTQIAKLSDNFSRSKASFLVSCIGLNVEQMTDLRKSLKKNQGDIQVIRNTLSVLAMEDQPDLKTVYEPLLEGPNAFVLAYEDVAQIAKIIDKVSEDHKVFQIKKAVFEGQVLDQKDVKVLASLPTAEVLKAQFLGLLSAPLSKFLSTMKEAPQSFVRLLSAKKDQTKPPETK